MRTRQILCPTDFSETASHALKYAIEMANFYKVGFRLLNVIEQPYGDENYQILAITPEELAENMEEDAAARMRDILSELNSDLPIETVLRHGSPATQILEEAKDSDVGMIVMASHGRTGLSHFLHANVAEEIVNKAACPVLVVK
ncbi:universal stress protein [Shewanella gelidii]|uniref:Universal stress protein A n=1 Tax=Shewanella gelidii TaxID=1642821 RepID=A0A917JQJ8_9GAMM|nr:universal stress protein [Shewanella gelidii]MCL1099286.1 universal stress protein [Shewanella gelidii]GGI77697.1 universal stress protein A [Shewanella gelidii]